jgi:hypothetical protein
MHVLHIRPIPLTFDKVPLTRGKSYYNKQEGDWWQQVNLPERLDDDYSEMESTFMERQTLYRPLLPLSLVLTSAPRWNNC